ncbi:hypothetical protein PO909_028195, partial [Leuciscus waleckii]
SECISLIYNRRQRYHQCCGTCTCVTECVDVQMCGLVADGIVQHTAVGVFILIFHLQR